MVSAYSARLRPDAAVLILGVLQGDPHGGAPVRLDVFEDDLSDDLLATEDRERHAVPVPLPFYILSDSFFAVFVPDIRLPRKKQIGVVFVFRKIGLIHLVRHRDQPDSVLFSLHPCRSFLRVFPQSIIPAMCEHFYRS